MARYDRGMGQGMGRRPLGYGHQYRDWNAPWGMSGRGPRPRGFGGYGYGESHPQYGGYPGGPSGGMYYGGRGPRPSQRYDADRGRGGMSGWGEFRGWGTGYEGYDRGYGGGGGYARDTFLPEEAYRRHPEYDRPRHQVVEWGDDEMGPSLDMDDEEVRRSVRESLFNDGWVPADRIEVEVNGGVVTLTGEVSDYMEARYAWDDTWETPGVRGVVNQLTVRTDAPKASHGDVAPQTSSGKKK